MDRAVNVWSMAGTLLVIVAVSSGLFVLGGCDDSSSPPTRPTEAEEPDPAWRKAERLPGQETVDKGEPAHSVSEAHVVQQHVGNQKQQILADLRWSGYRISANGQTYQVYVREYPNPIMLGKALKGLEFSEDNRRSPLGLLFLSYHLGRTAGLKERSELFVDPEKAMSHFEWLATQQGSMETVAENLRTYSEKALETEELLGEAIIGELYMYVYRREGWPPTFYSYIRGSDGIYRIPNSIPEQFAPLLNNHRLLTLFPKYKDAWDEYHRKRMERLEND